MGAFCLGINRCRFPPILLLREFRPLELQPVGTHLRQVILDLLRQASSQLLPPNTWEDLTAISGDMPRFSLISADKEVRVTLRAAPVSVMLSPEAGCTGAIQNRRVWSIFSS